MFCLFLSVLFTLPSPHAVTFGSFCHFRLCLAHSNLGALHTPVSFVKVAGWLELVGDTIRREIFSRGPLLSRHWRTHTKVTVLLSPALLGDLLTAIPRKVSTRADAIPGAELHHTLCTAAGKATHVHCRAHRVVCLFSPHPLQNHVSSTPYYYISPSLALAARSLLFLRVVTSMN